MAAQVESQVLMPTIPCRYAKSVSCCHQEQSDKLAHRFLVCLSTLCMSVSSLKSVGTAVTPGDTATGQGRVL